MSRSYRHGKYAPACYDKSYKKIYNRRLRRSGKYKDPESIPSGSAYKKLNEPWNIVDLKIDTTWETYKKWNQEENAYAIWKRVFKSK